jgi:hypothetical protein
MVDLFLSVALTILTVKTAGVSDVTHSSTIRKARYHAFDLVLGLTLFPRWQEMPTECAKWVATSGVH